MASERGSRRRHTASRATLADVFDDALRLRMRKVQEGWVGWVAPGKLTNTWNPPKERPWCCADANARSTWIPRTTSRPAGTQWAVFSPPGALAGLEKPGWFMIDHYASTPVSFDPEGDFIGYLDGDTLRAIRRKLSSLYQLARSGPRAT